MKGLRSSRRAKLRGPEGDLDAGIEKQTLEGNHTLSQSIEEYTLETIIEEAAIGYVVIPSHPLQEIEGTTSSTDDQEKVLDDEYIIISPTVDCPKCTKGEGAQLFLHTVFKEVNRLTRMAASHVAQNHSLLRRRLRAVSNAHGWESSTNIKGGQLILPGQLITLDEPNMPPKVAFENEQMRTKECQTMMFSAYDMLPIQESPTSASQYDCQSHPKRSLVLSHGRRALGITSFARGKATRSLSSFMYTKRQVFWIANVAEWIQNHLGLCLSLRQKNEKIAVKEWQDFARQDFVFYEVELPRTQQTQRIDDACM